MSRRFIKKVLTCVALCSMVAGISQAAIIRYHGSGDYLWLEGDGQAQGWQSAVLPGPGDVIRCNWGGYYGEGPIVLTNAAPQEVAAFQLGVDEGGHLVVGDGGSLIANGSDTEGNKVGNNNNCQGKLTVDAGGSVTVNAAWLMVAGNSLVTGIVELNGGTLTTTGHLWCATGADSTAQININSGTLSVGKMIGLGTPDAIDPSGGIATININGGTLALSNIAPETSIQPGSKINIALTGEVTLPGDRSNVISNYVDAGRILGYGLTNNVDIAVVIDPPGTTNTIITAKDAAVPDLTGMDLTTVTNTLDLYGFTVGAISNYYVFDASPGTVFIQDPAAGESASPGAAIDMIIYEPMAAETEANNFGSGDWMEPANWDTGIVPERETQGYKARSYFEDTLTLSNFVAVKTLVWGDGGYGQLDIEDGGHLVTGFGWAAIGYNDAATLNVYAGGVFEVRSSLWFARDGIATTCYMNIDGGSVIVKGDWMSLGPTAGTARGEITVKNGGYLNFARFRNDYTNGVITMYEGVMEWPQGWRVTQIQSAIDTGLIVIAPGYSYSLSDATGSAVLTGYLPGYAAWADSFLPTVIGAEGDNYDGDADDNYTEYVLNGDPTNGLVTSVQPTFEDVGGSFTYTHLIRNDDPALVYTVETKTDLMAPSWSGTGHTILGTNSTDSAAYDEVGNSIPTTADETFIQLRVTTP